MDSLIKWVQGSKKAIVAFLVTALVGYLARHGWHLDVQYQDALRTLLEGLVGGITVWFTRNQVGSVYRRK